MGPPFPPGPTDRAARAAARLAAAAWARRRHDDHGVRPERPDL